MNGSYLSLKALHENLMVAFLSAVRRTQSQMTQWEKYALNMPLNRFKDKEQLIRSIKLYHVI